jgi:hypothetical protein
MQSNIHTTNTIIVNRGNDEEMTLKFPGGLNGADLVEYLKLIPKFLTYSDETIKDMFNENDESF